MREDTFVPGDHNAICFECGRKRKASELVKHWQGYHVCPEHWEPRHNQDFVRGVPEEKPAPWTQQYSDDFIAVCSPAGSSCLADYAVASCSICEYVPPDTYELI